MATQSSLNVYTNDSNMFHVWAAVSILVVNFVLGTCGQLVTTNSGQLLGRKLESREGYEYYAYKGIPYAEKPERFKVSCVKYSEQ